MKIKYQNGVSLIEVMVALFVLGVGLLGVLAMQAESMKLNQQAYGSTQAMFLANDIVERMRVNMLALTPEQQAQPTQELVFSNADLTNWKTDILTPRLPGSSAEIERIESTVFKVTLTYPIQSLDNQQLDEDVSDAEYVLYARL